jgi:predicted nucleotidyltransferase
VIRPNRSSPYYHELRSLLLKSYGPASVLGAVLEGRDGVKDAYIYGSWAARYSGEPGPDPQDIDLVVVLADEADRSTIEDDLVTAGDELGRQVNPVLVTERDWADTPSPFLRTVRGRPLVRLPVTQDDDVDR